MTLADPTSRFPSFYANPAIRLLATAARWTVSGRLSNDPEATNKAPIDVRHLLDGCNAGCQHIGPVRGAWDIGPACLVTLAELSEGLPSAANTAFYVQAAVDGLMIIDIEPDCPQQISSHLLNLPGAVYIEQSMSGRGFHILAPLPANFHEYPTAANKKVLREEHGWYEILLDHWVTFTREPVNSSPVVADASKQRPRPPDFSTFEAVYASLAEAAAQTSAAAAVDIDTAVDIPHIIAGEQIIARVLDQTAGRFKTLDDFNGDTSRWEFSVLGTLYRQMLQYLLRYGGFHGVAYSTGDQAWLLYQAAQQVLPPRRKHHERRNGRPFLLDRAAAMIAAQQPDTD